MSGMAGDKELGCMLDEFEGSPKPSLPRLRTLLVLARSRDDLRERQVVLEDAAREARKLARSIQGSITVVRDAVKLQDDDESATVIGSLRGGIDDLP